MKISCTRATRVALLAASSFSALALTAPASAQGLSATDTDRVNANQALRHMVTSALTPDLRIITNDGPFITPGIGTPVPPPGTGIIPGSDYANSAQVLSVGVNGVGQMIAIELPFLSLCSGTLINPRTVITAAHCVNSNPKNFYGSSTGVGGGISGQDAQGFGHTNGIPLSFGFAPTNRCRGVAVNGCVTNTGPYETWRDSGFTSQPDKYIYNANQVWYHPDSGEFGLADVALVTLDTHVENVPTWTLLFSPLDGPTHTTITGYGSAGVGTTGIGDAAGIDYRRRSAENMIDALMSSADWAHNPFIGGPDFHDFDFYAHSLYWYDFDDPAYDPNNPTFADDSFVLGDPADVNAHPENYNWNFNGLGGGALPHEGTTAGGDSGGPLIVDTRYSKPVVAGVLTGGWSFNGGLGTYGEFSVYPPLFLYWQDIVANNPYKYVSAKAGNGDWFDPTHWVQDMDPNYSIAVGDTLLNTLPNVPEINQDSNAGRFGTVCAFEIPSLCSTAPTSPYPTSSGSYIVTAGGPGSTNFVPNNVEPNNSLNPNVYKQARYYDVTLREAGTTTLSGNATIDKLTLDGTGARLNIKSAGNLKVWSDFTQYSGWTNIDGKLVTGEAMVATGILSGGGTFDPRFLTVVGGAVAPGGAGIGTLSVKSDVVLASASGLLIDVMHGASDQLKVFSDADGTGVLALDGGSLLLSQAPGASLARAGDKFQIATAQGGVAGVFGSVGLSTSGVLTPNVTYDPNKITVTLTAGSLSSLIGGGNSTALAFANALDTLRGTSYGKLSNLYGNVDWMNGSQLTATFNSLAPSIFGETQLLQDRQSRKLFSNVSDRLSLLGTGQARGFSFSGSGVALDQTRQNLTPSEQLGLTSGQSVAVPVAGGLSGFVTGSEDSTRASYGDSRQLDAGQRNRYFASGVEAPFGDVMIGTAVGYAESTSNAGFDSATSKLTQAAAYVSVPLGKSAYVGGILAAERASSDSTRLSTDTMSTFRLSGTAHSNRYMATAEAGFRTGIGHGLSINPRMQLGVSHYTLGGLHEQGGETALELNRLTLNRVESRVGARLDGTAHIAGWTVTPQVQADYVRLLSGAKNGLNVSFASAPDYAFALPLTNGGSGWMEVKGGVEVARGALSFGLSGQATAGDAPISDQRGLVDVTFRF